MSHHWPVVLKSEELSLQALRFRDRGRWNNVRAENRDWLTPWEATIPLIPGEDAQNPSHLPSYFEMVRTLNSEARNGRSFSFAIWHQRNLIGQISLGGVILGAMRGGHIGYWIDKNYANRGFTTAIFLKVNVPVIYILLEIGETMSYSLRKILPLSRL
jgi:ribosomal-protein-alanine N-acetyltransferase